MSVALVGGRLVELLVVFVLLIGVPLIVLLVLGGAVAYVQQGVEDELAKAEERGDFDDDIGPDDGSGGSPIDDGSGDASIDGGERHDANEREG